nr:uncharacterized protein LOC119179065 [Rhipicephalus microplus]
MVSTADRAVANPGSEGQTSQVEGSRDGQPGAVEDGCRGSRSSGATTRMSRATPAGSTTWCSVDDDALDSCHRLRLYFVHGPAHFRQEPEAHVQQQEHEDPNVLPEVETSDAVHADAEVQRVCGNLRLPDETWNKLTFCSERDSALYGVCELEGEQVDHILLPNFKSGFGFNKAVFNALAIKTKDMDISSRHEGIIFDEMKLTEHFNVSAAGTVEGFVDLGKFTQEEDRTTPADHGMVMMFQPFQGDWTQILGVFSSKGNIKAEMLAKLLLEAILLSEQAGLFVDFVSCDGATWNRSMWRSFGIGASSVKTTCNVTHPVDPSRKLHFCSDFPHLVKCVRNSFVSTGFTTQDGRACVEDIEAAWEKDKSSLTLKAMPHITRVHIRPNSFEKMKVNLAFTLFSDEVLKGMFLFASDIDEISRSKLMPTVELVKRMSRLIAVMTSRCPREGLRPSSEKVAELEAFLLFMDHWEAAAKTAGGGFGSKDVMQGT